MKDSEIYLRAAELLEKTGGNYLKGKYGCCDFINYFSSKKQLQRDQPPDDKFSELFAPHYPELYWGNQWGNKKECYQCRVLALLFMHQIALDEERRK